MMTDTFGGECTTKRLLVLLSLGVGMLAVFGAMARIPSANLALNTYVALYLAAFVLYVLAARVTSGLSDGRMLIIICLFALLFRIVLLPVRPTISTDIYRYIWDGRVQAKGINPYAYPPDSPMLVSLQDHDWSLINYRGTHTPYPPFSQIVFGIVTRLFGRSVYPLKSVFLLCDLATIYVLLLMLRHLKIPLGSLALYAWSPLVVTEFAGAGHQDSMGILLLVLAIYLLIGRRPWMTGTLLAASVLVKPYSLLAVPILASRNWLPTVLMFLIAGIILSQPFLAARGDMLSGMTDYALQWQRNESLFSFIGSRPVAYLAMALVSLYMAWSDRRVIRSIFVTLAAAILLFPTVYPWYLAWTVPFLCFVRSPGWLLLTGLAGLFYVTSIYGEQAVRLITYLPVYLLLILPILPARLRFWERWTAAKDQP